MDRKVFIVDPDSYGILDGDKELREFHCKIKSGLDKYHVHSASICKKTIKRDLKEMNANDLLIVYNDDKDNKELEDVLSDVVKRKAKIWPVAMHKATRRPCKEIENYQSYDISDQLRRRALTDVQTDVLASVFCREIAAYTYPTLLPSKPVIFLSHKRSDGEDITAAIQDKITILAKDTNSFRDVVDVRVGDEAQKDIDIFMSDADAFVFFQTPEAAESEWIKKELNFALSHNIPIYWIKVDESESDEFRKLPFDGPHLSISSENVLADDEKLTEITDLILEGVSDLIYEKAIDSFNYMDKLEQLFGTKLEVVDEIMHLYKTRVERNNYRYQQRPIEQYFQIFGRMPHYDDESKLSKSIRNRQGGYDSVVVISDKVIRKKTINELGITVDSYNNFFQAWHRYLRGKKMDKNLEIVISGAFPDGDEIYKHNLVTALEMFGEVILNNGYELSFGAHPTFQELFYNLGQEWLKDECNEKLHMYISQYFLKEEEKSQLEQKYQLNVTEEGCDQDESLTILREKMISRGRVAALICLGGKVKNNPQQEGIREEIKIALANRIPVFVIGSVGGCSSNIAKEYSMLGWENINLAGAELNNHLMNGVDYYDMACKLISYLDKFEH